MHDEARPVVKVGEENVSTFVDEVEFLDSGRSRGIGRAAEARRLNRYHAIRGCIGRGEGIHSVDTGRAKRLQKIVNEDQKTRTKLVQVMEVEATL